MALTPDATTTDNEHTTTTPTPQMPTTNSPAMFVALFDHMPIPIVLFDRDGNAVAINAANERLVAASRQSIIGTYNILNDPEANEKHHVAYFRQALQGHVAAMPPTEYNTGKAQIVGRSTDRTLWTETTYFPMYDEQGDVAYVGEMNIDVTHRMQTEKAYEMLIEHSLQGLAIFQAQRIVFANPAMEQLSGYTIAELMTMPAETIFHMVHPEDRPVVLHNLHNRMAGIPTPNRYEFRARRKDGSMRWVEIYAAPMEYRGNLAAQATFIDITERKAAEEALRQAHNQLERRIAERTVELSLINNALQTEIIERKRIQQALQENEERYRTLVETSPSAIILTDIHGTIDFCNRRTAEMFRYASPTDLTNKTCAELIAPAHHNEIEPSDRLLHLLHSGTVRNSEYRLLRNDHSEFPAEINSALLTDRHGTPTALVIVIRDITDQKCAEEALVHSYEQLRHMNKNLTRSHNLLQALFNGLQDGLLLIDSTGTIEAVNRVMATLLGSTTDALLHQVWHITWHQEQADDTWRIEGKLPTLFHCDAFVHAQQHRTRYRSPEGAIHILDIQAIALTNHHHQPEQLIVHVVDVTRTIQLQTRVLENERVAASGRLAASVAHEINTPLQAIRTSIGLIRQIDRPEDRNLFLGQIEQEISRVAQIVRQLLDLHHPSITSTNYVSINHLIDRILLLIGSRVMEQNIHVETNIPDALPLIWGRADELLQVLLNLIVNALEAMPGSGVLSIAAAVTALSEQHNSEEYDATQQLTITIQDTGIGIPRAMQQRIFEPFVTTRQQGIGLGLAISMEIVRQHWGTIQVDSQEGAGSCFSVVLPIRVPHSAQQPFVNDNEQ